MDESNTSEEHGYGLVLLLCQSLIYKVDRSVPFMSHDCEVVHYRNSFHRKISKVSHTFEIENCNYEKKMLGYEILNRIHFRQCPKENYKFSR